MAFDTLEEGLESSRPLELYTFTVGSTTYRYTSAEDDYVDGVNTFTAVQGLGRTALTAGGPTDSVGTLTVEMPGTDAIAQLYIDGIPGVIPTVSIERVQRTDGSKATIFDGTIRSVSFENSGYLAKFEIVPAFSGIQREIPRFKFSSLCNHVLYDDRCQVDDTSASFRLSAAACTAVSGNTITVTGADANGDGYYTGGFVQTSSADDRRLILDQTGTVLTLLLPFTTSPLGSNVTVFAGCDHTIATCSSKFSNVVNFGGFAYVPTRNVFQSGLTQ